MIPRERHGNPFEDQSTAKKGMGDRDSGGDNNTDDKVRGADDNEHGTSEKLKRKDYETELRSDYTASWLSSRSGSAHEGQKVCILFRGTRWSGQGRRYQSHHRQGQPADLPGSRPCRRRPSERNRKCTFSATCRICQQAVRS